MVPRRVPYLVLLSVFFLWLPALLLAAKPATVPAPGFQGIPWGSTLAELPQLVLVEPDGRVDIYGYKKGPPNFANGQVEAIKLYSIDSQFARVMIRYRTEETHNRIKQALESTYGKLQHNRGSMIRGLNQEYSWRLEETEISLSYRELGERGLLMIQSRVLAPRFLDLLSDHTH
ncbi:MAG: hypothetical protein F4142_04645 [Nitrospira sp. SB0675_bin_23]|nr:hypothetical protein [Nitrospira sp. SB0675_bin_23]